jgi:mannose-1-phosphate guanylyltransferase
MSFEEKPDKGIIEYLSAGMYLFERTVLERIPNGVSSLEKETLPNLLKEEVFSFLVDTPQFDIGTPERLDMFRKVYLTTSHSSK